MDIIEPTLGDIIRENIRGAPKIQQVSVEMLKGDALDMPKQSLKKVSVAAGWDMASTAGRSIDVDISAVFFGKDGNDLGGVYFENPEANGLRHTGDNIDGNGDGDDEVIEVNLDDVPEHVHQILFVVNIYSKGTTLSSLQNAFCRVLDDSQRTLVHYELSQCKSHMPGLIIARFLRGRDRWCFQALGIYCNGRAWMNPSCIEDLKAVSQIPPAKLKKQIETLNTLANDKAKPRQHPPARTLHSGSMTILPEDHMDNTLRFALGWDIAKSCRKTADLDVSTMCFHHDGRHLGSVYFDNMDEFGIKHTGDTENGTGDGDDEIILVDLLEIPDYIASIFFVVHIYTKGLSFEAVTNAYLRIVDANGHELIRSAITRKKPHKTGLVMAELWRKSENLWGFQVHGIGCNGRSCRDSECVNAIQRIIFTKAVRQAGKRNEILVVKKPETNEDNEDKKDCMEIPIHLSHTELSHTKVCDGTVTPETDSDTSTKVPDTPRKERIIVSL